MNARFFLLAVSFMISIMFCYSQGQVGINTETPLATLDINGNLRIGNVTQNAAAGDVLVLGTNNVVQHRTMAGLAFDGAHVVKGKSTSGTPLIDVSLTLIPNWNALLFQRDIDSGLLYNPTTGYYTVPDDGIYLIYVQTEMNASVLSVGVSVEAGIGIFLRKKATSTNTLLTSEVFMNANVNIVLLNVKIGSPLRKATAVVQLEKDDQIAFGAYRSLATLNVLGGGTSYFYIQRIK